MSDFTYTGAEWTNLLRQLNQKQMRAALRGGFKRAANNARKLAVQSLRTSGIKVRGNSADWARGVRTFTYTRGSGFAVTVKPRRRGAQSMHKNRQGLLKPILMWAEDGTDYRQTRGRGRVFKSGRRRTGKMPAYHFIEKAEPQMIQTVEQTLIPELETAVRKQAAKAGFN